MGRSPLSRFADACVGEAPTTARWLERVSTAAAPIFERGGGAGAGFCLFSPDPRLFVRAGVGPCTELAMLNPHELATASDLRRLPQPFATTTLSDRFEVPTMRGHPFWSLCQQTVGDFRWADAVALGVVGPSSFGVLCTVVGDRGFDTPRWREVRLMRRHLLSTAHARLSCSTPEGPHAVLTPDGRLASAAPGIGARDRAVLEAAVRALEKARTGADSQGESDGIWRELLAGGWSAVEHVDTDGKRLLLLARAEAASPSALTAGEAEILARVDEGLSNKQIAIEFGLSDAAVSVRLATALRKLRFTSLVEYLRHTRPARPSRGTGRAASSRQVTMVRGRAHQ